MIISQIPLKIMGGDSPPLSVRVLWSEWGQSPGRVGTVPVERVFLL